VNNPSMVAVPILDIFNISTENLILEERPGAEERLVENR